jgi:tetratricopeptide (TPR) repeat protein
VLRAEPTRASTHLSLARAHALAGRRELASQHASAAASGDPGRAFEMLAELTLSQGRLADAADYARQSLAADPERVLSQYVLGVVAQRAGRCAEALGHFERAAEARRRQRRLVVRGLYSGMGDCLARLGRETEAERAFGDEIQQIPFSREGRVGLALLYRSQGRDAEMREALAGIVRSHPKPGADEYWVVVRTLAGLGDAASAREWAAEARRLFPGDARFRG